MVFQQISVFISVLKLDMWIREVGVVVLHMGVFPEFVYVATGVPLVGL